MFFLELKEEKEIFQLINEYQGLFNPKLLDDEVDIKLITEKLFKYGLVIVLYDDNDVVSFISGYINDDSSKIAFINFFAVTNDYRNKGISKRVLQEFENKAKMNGMQSIRLEVKKHNLRAQTIYSKFGFVYEAEASNTSIYMIKDLSINSVLI